MLLALYVDDPNASSSVGNALIIAVMGVLVVVPTLFLVALVVWGRKKHEEDE